MRCRFLLAIFLVASPAAAQTGPVVTYAGVMDQDGCPHCCHFDCRLTPTPTPAFDHLGRQIFARQSGRFLFIVEGGLGTSARPPSVAGTRRNETIEPLGAFSRPGLQVRFNRNLGNGSTFIECGTTLVGGVPAAVGLTETQLTNALIDAACRFEWVPASDACTRNRAGSFSPISSSTMTQYCFQVPDSAAFANGDTVVSVQLRDALGNLGPIEEIVVRVGTVLPTPTPTPTVTGNLSISGSITHYRSGAAVADITLEEEASGRTTITGLAGTYALQQLPAAPVAISARKVGGLGRGVSPLDAAFVLQALALKRTLDERQSLACDATGNGALSNLDATRILQWSVGLIDRLPVSEVARCDSEWAFVPVPAAAANQTVVTPSTAGGICRAGSIHYDPLSASASGQSFLAIPFGDCTGNWQPGTDAARTSSIGSRSAVRLGRSLRQHSRVEVPLYVDTEAASGVLVEVSYDARTLVARRTRRGTTPDMLMVENRTKPGRLRLALAGKIGGAGSPAAVLRFRARSGRRVGEPAIGIVDAVVESE